MTTAISISAGFATIGQGAGPMMVTWKAGVTPVLLVKDDQIKSLASKGELTMTATHIILNCPIVHPTKSAFSGH